MPRERVIMISLIKLLYILVVFVHTSANPPPHSTGKRLRTFCKAKTEDEQPRDGGGGGGGAKVRTSQQQVCLIVMLTYLLS